MLVNLLALTAFTMVPSSMPNYGYSVDCTVQAQKRDSYEDRSGDYYTIDNRYMFYCHLFYNNENDFQFYYSGVQWSVSLYDEDRNEYVAFYNESWYLESDLLLSSSSTFDISTYFAGGMYTSTITYDYRETVDCELDLDHLVQPVTPVYFEDMQCIWAPIFNFDLPAIINSNSYQIGYNTGFDDGMKSGNKAGYNIGYNDGYTDAQADGGVPAIIFGGVLNIAMIPVNFFLAILNFEVFGINIGGFVTGLMTIAIIIILFGVIFGGRPAPRGGPSGGGK